MISDSENSLDSKKLNLTSFLKDIELNLEKQEIKYTIKDTIRNYEFVRNEILKNFKIEETQRKIKNKILKIEKDDTVFLFEEEVEEEDFKPIDDGMTCFLTEKVGSENEEENISETEEESDSGEENIENKNYKSVNKFFDLEAELSGEDSSDFHEDEKEIQRELKEANFIEEKSEEEDYFKNLEVYNDETVIKEKKMKDINFNFKTVDYGEYSNSTEEESIISEDEFLLTSVNDYKHKEEKEQTVFAGHVNAMKQPVKLLEFSDNQKIIENKLNEKEDKKVVGFQQIKK